MKLLFNFSVEILLEKRYPTLRGFGLMHSIKGFQAIQVVMQVHNGVGRMNYNVTQVKKLFDS